MGDETVHPAGDEERRDDSYEHRATRFVIDWRIASLEKRTDDYENRVRMLEVSMQEFGNKLDSASESLKRIEEGTEKSAVAARDNRATYIRSVVVGVFIVVCTILGQHFFK